MFKTDLSSGNVGPDVPSVLHRRRLIQWAGLAASLACLVFFLQRILALGATLPLPTGEILVKVPYAVLSCLIAVSLAACAWCCLIRLLGVDLSLSRGIGIFFVTQFGKYLPGNVGHHIGRVAVACQYSVPLATVLTSMVIEAGLVVGLALLFGIPVLARYVATGSVWFLAGAVAAVLVGVAFWSRRQSLRAARAAFADRLCEAPVKWLVPVALTAVSILFSSTGLLLLDPAFTAGLDTSLYVVSVFCAAWVAGFLTPGAPAGLGIRELILSAGLTPIAGTGGAAIAAILLRVVTTLTDLVAFGIGLVLVRCARH